MKLIVLALCVVAVSAHSIGIEEDWEQWKGFHGKKYDAAEEAKREYIWSQNLKKVIQHNMEEQNGVHTYTLGMNQFADMDIDEFRDLILSRVTRPENTMSFCNQTYDKEDASSKESVDWRNQGFVTPVKNQEQCGSCWSFSATGSLEGQHFKKTGKLVSLSEQNLVDCSEKEGDHGCQGGLMDSAFEYIMLNGGIDTESSYPYTAKNGKCHYSPMNKGATVTQCVDIKRGNEKALQGAVEKIGPISVAIDAGHQSFQLYKSGIYYEPKCSPVKLDHGVLAVGFGVTDDGEDYWLVKNSWGEVWGEKGYIMMSRGKDNNCGIATQASYPTV